MIFLKKDYLFSNEFGYGEMASIRQPLIDTLILNKFFKQALSNKDFIKNNNDQSTLFSFCAMHFNTNQKKSVAEFLKNCVRDKIKIAGGMSVYVGLDNDVPTWKYIYENFKTSLNSNEMLELWCQNIVENIWRNSSLDTDDFIQYLKLILPVIDDPKASQILNKLFFYVDKENQYAVQGILKVKRSSFFDKVLSSSNKLYFEELAETISLNLILNASKNESLDEYTARRAERFLEVFPNSRHKEQISNISDLTYGRFKILVDEQDRRFREMFFPRISSNSKSSNSSSTNESENYENISAPSFTEKYHIHIDGITSESYEAYTLKFSDGVQKDLQKGDKSGNYFLFHYTSRYYYKDRQSAINACYILGKYNVTIDKNRCYHQCDY